MSGDLMISVNFNGDENLEDMFQIPYNIVWADLEAMLKAQFDCERISVSYIDTENDEVSIGSQEELFEAFRIAMTTKDTLHLKVMPLTSEAAVFRMPDCGDDDDDVTEPLQLREICPDPKMPIAMPSTDIDETDGAEPKVTAKVQPISAIRFPDSNLELVHSQTEPVRREDDTDDLTDRLTAEDSDERSRQLLQYSDFVSFMTKLKKELRTEIVRDVTRKTVKQVLKGLDGAVIESMQGSGAVAGETRQGAIPKVPSEHEIYVHEGVSCDHCNQIIVGPRYKCGNCLDFDLCEMCESRTCIHDPDHVFVKIRRPCYRVGVHDGIRKPLLKSVIYKSHKRSSTKLIVPIPGESMENELNFKLESKMKDIFVRNEDKKRKKDEKKMEKLRRKEEKLKRRLESRTDHPHKREKLDLLDNDDTVRYDFYKVLMSSKFLGDVTVPDSTQLPPETRFVKTWRMRNDGDGPWSDSTKLKCLKGNLHAPLMEVPVPHLQPGEEGTISVDFVTPAESGEYQSFWKLHEHGMEFGVQLWCMVVVTTREMLEPTAEEKDSLKVVTVTEPEGEKEEEKEEIEEKDQIEITFRNETDEEHLREVLVRREERALSPVSVETDGVAVATGGGQDVEVQQGEVKDEVVSESEAGEGFVVYAKAGDMELVEVEKREKKEARDQSVSLETDLTTAVARLSLAAERKEGNQAASYTPTPTNTPFDVTPLKTPNPEPEEEPVEPEPLKAISPSSSVEFVPVPEGEEAQVETAHYVRQRMASLELKPDIDLESVSSYSDDDEDSSLSDSDYIIVPLPDCFDITKPLSQSMLSSYSNSTDRAERDFSLDDNHNTLSHRSSRAVSVDVILTTSGSLAARPLSPVQHVGTENQGSSLADVAKEDPFEDTLEPEAQAVANGNNADTDPSTKPAEGEDSLGTEQPGAVGSPGVTLTASDIGANAEVVSLEQITPLGGSTNESGASGGNSEEEFPTLSQSGEVTSDQTVMKEPVSASAQMPENVVYVKKGDNSAKTVDFAPDFANQLVATAVNAAGQAYITAKAVFKTWQDKQNEAKEKEQAKAIKPTGWKPAATQWSPPEEDYTPPKSEWVPPKSTFKPPESSWKPPSDNYKVPEPQWKPEPEPETKATPLPWKPSKETGPMGKLFDMGFFDRDLNMRLLRRYDNNLEKVVQDLLQRKN